MPSAFPKRVPNLSPSNIYISIALECGFTPNMTEEFSVILLYKSESIYSEPIETNEIEVSA